jgi:peptidyl-tRNA hydrolase
MERPDESIELTEKRKMYVVVRRDLPPGLRAAQAGHAVAEMCLRFPESAHQWNDDSNGNYLIILEVHDEGELLEFYEEVKSWDILREFFREPDLCGQLTALAALPDPSLNHVFAELPLAFRRRSWIDFVLRRDR